jgi:Holliday junction resolvase
MARKKLESLVQSKLIRDLRDDGWFVVRLLHTTPSGVPDLLAIKNKKHVFIEVKREGGKVSPLQKEIHKRIAMVGGVVVIATNAGLFSTKTYNSTR